MDEGGDMGSSIKEKDGEEGQPKRMKKGDWGTVRVPKPFKY